MTNLRLVLSASASVLWLTLTPRAMAQCYVDSQNGSDLNDGSSRDKALKSLNVA